MPVKEGIDDYTVRQVLKVMSAFYRDQLRVAKANEEDLARFFFNGKLFQNCMVNIVNEIYTEAERAIIFANMKKIFADLLEGSAWEGVIP